ncbi:MAG: FkbM family methyltransferase [Magnetococcales bacterium]|nr:FkbM family methyltransferase [Magnetococcales bacterium]
MVKKSARPATAKKHAPPHSPPPAAAEQPDILFAQAAACHHQGEWTEANRLYQAYLATHPHSREGWYNWGLLQQTLGAPKEAEQGYRQALDVDPNYDKAAINLGALLFDQRRFPDALNFCQSRLQRRPDDRHALLTAGMTLQALDRVEEARTLLQRAVELTPDWPEALNALGMALQSLGKSDEALARFDQAVRLAPGLASAHNNRAVVLKQRGRLDKALEATRQAVQCDPDFAVALSNQGTILYDLLRHDEAMACFHQALRLKPDFAEAHGNLGQILLTLGRFDEGWPEYEWRLHFQKMVRHPQPRWNPAEAGRFTVLIQTEQGLGDVIQFSRFLSRLQGLDHRFVWEVPPPLVRQMKGLAEASGVAMIPQGEPLPPFDRVIPLLSLPLALGLGWEEISRPVPPLQPEADKAARWAARMADEVPEVGLRVGLVWRGSPNHNNDANRSLPPEALLPLFQIPGVRFFSLQKERGGEGLAIFARAGARIVDWTAGLEDFTDTAALMSHLDLVIAVDTSVVHLAGAMGRPAWVMLPYRSDWRWLLNRSDSPWHPSLRLFRQPRPGDWEAVLRQVGEELAALTLARGVPPRVGKPQTPSLDPPQPYAAAPTPGAARSPVMSDLPVPFTLVVPTVYGLMMVNRHDINQTNALIKTGKGHSHDEVELLAHLLKLCGTNQTVLDIGANFGVISLGLARSLGPEGTIHAFEAQRIIFYMLAGSVALNALMNVHCHHLAVGDVEGEIEIPQFDYAAPLNFGSIEFGPEQTEPLNQQRQHDPSRREKVAMTFIDRFDFPRVDLMKIDVEGMEMKVLEGAKQTIARCRPILNVEYIKSDRAALRQRIESMDYAVYINGVNYLCLPTELTKRIIVQQN